MGKDRIVNEMNKVAPIYGLSVCFTGDKMSDKNNMVENAEFGSLPIWDLNDLYPSVDAVQLTDDLDKVQAEILAFAADYEGKLEATLIAGGMVETLARYEAISRTLGRVGSFAFLMYAQNTIDTDRMKFLGDMQDKLTTWSSHLMFFGLELNTIDAEVFVSAFAADPELARFKPWFDELRKARPHQLEARIEQLFNEKSATGFAAWNRLYDETLASLVFEVDGEEKTLEQTLTQMSSHDAGKRKAAFEALAKTLSENKRLFVHIMNVLAKDKEISDRWHGFEDVADSRHLENSVERDVVDALETAVREAYPRLSHRYYKLKAKWFGKDKLDAWDRNAPLPGGDDRVFSWAEAEQTVMDAYARFSPELADIAKPFFEKGWIDAEARPGKRSGAFAHPTVTDAHPYLMLNYMGKTRDIMTLAHELGHGVHQVLAAEQGELLSATPLTLAETASVFGEMLTFRYILEKTTDPKQRFALIASKVEDMLNTVVRQISFYSFERKVHIARRNGELRPEEIDGFWMEVSSESLGDGIELNAGYESLWSYIGHFIHAPFYVYAYAFGDCLVNSLYAQYEKQSEGFAERYFELLKAGGSKHHSELLAPFGLDARDPGFWSMGLSMIEQLIIELESTQP